MKHKISNILGWLLLASGLLLYIVPLFESLSGHYSGLLAFALIFVGISLLKYRKDQINKKQINRNQINKNQINKNN